VPNRRSSSTERLAVELEAATLRALRHSYLQIDSTFFRMRLRPPRLMLTDSASRWGRWDGEHRTLEISRQLVLHKDWGVVLEVLKHEIAHQYVDEVLQCRDQAAHGPAFRQVCKERGFDARSAGLPSGTSEAQVETRILQRVSKLLALAESPNVHEAQNATVAAQRLMLKYNIDSVAEHRPHAYGFRQLGKPTGRTTAAARMLASILGDHFFVEAIWVPVWRPLEGKRGTVLEVCGTPENLELAAYTHSFLNHTAAQLWDEHKRQHGIKKNTDRQSFVAGVMAAFWEKLEAQKRANRKAGLVWVGDRDLDTYFRKRHPHVRRTRLVGRHRPEAYVHGMQAGRSIVLRRGVKQGRSGRRPMLGDGRG
jgi:hypothetical protein